MNNEMISHTLDDSFGGSSGLDYTAAPVEELDKNIYSVAQISTDISGSVSPFVKQLETALKNAIDGIEDKSQSDAKKGVAMLLRSSTFQSSFGGGNDFNEIHGFQQIADIDLNNYNLGHPMGGTPLLDCMVRDLDIQQHFSDEMSGEDILSSAFLIWITDGDDTASTATEDQVRAKLERLIQSEDIDSVTTVLIGVNDNKAHIKKYLEDLKANVNIDYYIPYNKIEQDGGKALSKFITEASKTVSSSASSGVKPDLSDIIDL